MRTAVYSFVVVIAFLLLGICLTCRDAFADTNAYELIIELDTVYAAEGQVHVQLPVMLTSSVDSIAGFSLLLQVDRPGVCSLRTTPVTAGTLTEDWPVMVGNDPGGSGYVVKYTGVSILLPDSIANPIPPQTTAAPLFIVELDIFDPVAAFEEGVQILIATAPVDQFNFSDPQGHSLGTVWQQFETTECWHCDVWADTVCLNWTRVSTPPCDSTFTYPDSSVAIDTSLVHVGQGRVDVVDWLCGDFDGNQALNLTDLTLMVNFVFLEGSPPWFEGIVDLNNPCTSGINLTDLTLLVNHLFVDNQPLDCCFAAP